VTSSSIRDPHGDTPRGSRSATFRVVLLGVLVLALIAAVGTLTWLLATRRGEADDEQRQREAVMSQAQQFMLRLNTYGPDLLDDQGQMPKYRELVSSVITPKFRTSFDSGVVAAEQTVAKAGLSREAKVFATGVSTIDADSATALVAGSFTNSYPDAKGELVPDESAPFRIEVRLVKTKGAWLVDDFTPVTGAEK
jgi:Mce-associated membrane protein